MNSLPILLPYTTSAHEEFATRFSAELARHYPAYRFPELVPVEGERFVMNSFSEEWREYQYDGVIWELDYDDMQTRFALEIGPSEQCAAAVLEVGCGLGITTAIASGALSADAVGLDLSFAAMRATEHFKANPFLQFVQGSAFYPPVKRGAFDLVYSRGVLHHTYSTEKAFASVASTCKSPGGKFYLWVYGEGSIRENLFRQTAYFAERIFRPLLSRNPSSALARLFLGTTGLLYVGFNRLRRFSNPRTQPLTLDRGIHAARDRFTPRFAHRHRPGELQAWFRAAGFQKIEVVDWRTMPAAEQDDYRRNVGVRGVR